MSEPQQDFQTGAKAKIGLEFDLSFHDAQGNVISTVHCKGEVQPAQQENGNGNLGS